MASIVHQLSSSDDDSKDSFPDLGVRVKSVEKHEPEAVDLTLSSDSEDVVNTLQEEPLSLPVYKAPRLSEEEPFAVSDLTECEPQHHKGCLPHIGGQQKPRRATSKEEQKAARQQREDEKHQRKEEKQRRAAEKHQHILEKEAAKARREKERTVSRAQKPGECLKLLVVELERRLVEAKEGGRVLSQLQEAGVTCRVVDGQVAASVTFFRGDPLSGKESQAEEAVVVMGVKDFVSAVGQQMHGREGGGGLCHLCRQWQATLGIPHLSLVVCGVEDYLRKQKKEKQQQVRSAVKGRAKQCDTFPLQHITRADIETALVTAQMECRVNNWLLPDGEKVALYVQQVAKAVAEAPYKHEQSKAVFSWYAEGSSRNSVKVDKNGVGLYKLWQQQLRQFGQVGVEVAQAVASRYPSPQALVQAYRRCGSQGEAEHLLADLRVRRAVGPLASEKRVGPALSKKIHLFLTSKDPNASLAQT